MQPALRSPILLCTVLVLSACGPRESADDLLLRKMQEQEQIEAMKRSARFDVETAHASDCSTPQFEVSTARVDDTCSRLGNYCLTVHCDVASRAAEAQTGTITFEGSSDRGTTTQKRELSLGAFERTRVTMDFPDAKITDSRERGLCRLVGRV